MAGGTENIWGQAGHGAPSIPRMDIVRPLAAHTHRDPAKVRTRQRGGVDRRPRRGSSRAKDGASADAPPGKWRLTGWPNQAAISDRSASRPRLPTGTRSVGDAGGRTEFDRRSLRGDLERTG